VPLFRCEALQLSSAITLLFSTRAAQQAGALSLHKVTDKQLWLMVALLLSVANSRMQVRRQQARTWPHARSSTVKAHLEHLLKDAHIVDVAMHCVNSSRS
jgi:hypothetical protein